MATFHTSSLLVMTSQVTFVGEGFTRKAPKYERFIRPTGLRFKKAHVTHPELKATFHLDILGVKKNPSSPLYTQVPNLNGDPACFLCLSRSDGALSLICGVHMPLL